MSIGLKANSDGTSGAIQVNGTDFVTVGGTATTPNGVTVSSSNSNCSQLILSGYNAFGGAGYQGFLSATNTYNGTTKTRHMRLDATGTIEFVNNAYTIVTHSFTDAGNITAYGNITGYSDRKLKKDIVTIGSALDKVCAMRGVYYTRIDTDTKNIGVIAQEVQEVFPEAVLANSSEDGDVTLSVAYGNLVGALIEAIKELRAEVEELKGR